MSSEKFAENSQFLSFKTKRKRKKAIKLKLLKLFIQLFLIVNLSILLRCWVWIGSILWKVLCINWIQKIYISFLQTKSFVSLLLLLSQFSMNYYPTELEWKIEWKICWQLNGTFQKKIFKHGIQYSVFWRIHTMHKRISRLRKQ